MAKIKTATTKPEKKKIDFMAVLTGIWMVAMTAILPLYSQRAYADIITAKYGFMLIADGVLLGGFIIWALIAGRPKKYIDNMKSYADPGTGKWFVNWFKNSFNWLDIFVLAFFVIVIISLLCASPFVYQAFFGNEGRWIGAITLMLWCLTFFVASRYFKFSNWFVTAFLIGTLLVTIWSITDYFALDVMGFKYGIDPAKYEIFTSSIGNIDIYCGFAAIPMAFAGIILIFSKEKIYKLVFYWICFAAAILSMITSAADNAYLAIAVFFAFTPLAAFKTRCGIRRYLLTLATFVTAIALVEYWDKVFRDIVVIPQGLITFLSEVEQIKYVAIALWVLVIALYIFDLAIKRVSIDAMAPRWIHTVWMVLLCVSIAGIIAMFAIANQPSSALPSVLVPLEDYLIFDNDWGTGRAYLWKKLLEIYGELPFIHKLFGTGPETACIYIYNLAYYDVAENTGFLFDTPHNEWLMMFFNLGPFGFISYMGVMITPVVMALRRSLKKYYPIVLAVGFVCICHLGESFVNVTVPIELTVIFALLAMAQSLFRSKE